MAVLLTTDATRGFAMRISRENSVIEYVTAGLMLMGGVFGLLLAWRAKGSGKRWWVWGFFLVFSVGMMVVGMEELAWGQKLFGFDTPAVLEGVNEQQEMTLHNLPGLHGHSDMMWTTFALGGLIGIALGRRALFAKIAPPVMLAPWFLMILMIAVPLIWKDYSGADNRLLTLFHRMDEFNEMLIAIASYLYVWLCARRLAGAHGSGSDSNPTGTANA